MKRPEIGVSIASYLPYRAQKASEWAEEDGFDFLQILPLKRLTGKERWDLPVRYVQPAWNPVNCALDIINKTPGDHGLIPQWWDWIFFPNKNECKNTYWEMKNGGAEGVVNTYNQWRAEGDILEVSPENFGEIQRRGVNGQRCLAMDLFHLRRQKYNNGDYLEHWLTIIPKIISNVEIVHVHPTDIETNLIQKGNVGEEEEVLEIEEMLRFISGYGYNGPYLIEASPINILSVINIKKHRQVLKSIRDIIIRANNWAMPE